MKKEWKQVHKGGGGAVYGLGFVGALIYFLVNANGLLQIILGLLKAIIWPAILVFHLFQFLGV